MDLPITAFGRNQPQYLELPAFVYPDGRVVSRWKVSWKERLQILFCGDLWLTVKTLHHKLQPVKIESTCPVFNDIPWDSLTFPDVVPAYVDPPDSEKQ